MSRKVLRNDPDKLFPEIVGLLIVKISISHKAILEVVRGFQCISEDLFY